VGVCKLCSHFKIAPNILLGKTVCLTLSSLSERLLCGCKILLQYLSVGLFPDTLYCIVLTAECK